MPPARYFSDLDATKATCFLCAGAHVKGACPNRLCYSCGAIGHVKCDKRAEGCWNCLGRHLKDSPCLADVFSGEDLDVSVKGGAMCAHCSADNHLSCKQVVFSGEKDWWGEGGLEHCTLCGEDGHTAWACRKLTFIPRLVNMLRQNKISDPRFVTAAQPEGLTPGPPLEVSTPAKGAKGPGKGKSAQQGARNGGPASPTSGGDAGGDDGAAPTDRPLTKSEKQEMKRIAGGRSPAAQARRDEKQAKKKAQKRKRNEDGGGEGGAAKKAKKG